jgi:DNA-binding NtrC family response regulator
MESKNTEITDVEKEPLLPLSEARELLDIVYLINALLQTGGNATRAAEQLKMGRRTIYEFMEKHGISCAEGKLSIQLTPLLRYVEVRERRLEKYLT